MSLEKRWLYQKQTWWTGVESSLVEWEMSGRMKEELTNNCIMIGFQQTTECQFSRRVM
jgi:hypothetical protein